MVARKAFFVVVANTQDEKKKSLQTTHVQYKDTLSADLPPSRAHYIDCWSTTTRKMIKGNTACEDQNIGTRNKFALAENATFSR